MPICSCGSSVSLYGWKSFVCGCLQSRQTHYWILGCLAPVGTARGGGRMKDDCTAAGVLCRERDCVLCLSVSFCTFLCGSKLGTLIPSRQSPSLLQQDVCHTVLIKRRQHAPLPLVLQLICSTQITNVYQRRQRTPPTISLRCSFFSVLFSLLFQSFYGS